MGIYPCQPYAKKKDFFRALQSLPLKTQCRGCLGIMLHHPVSLDHLLGLSNLNAACGAKRLLDVALRKRYGKLTGSKGTDHEETGTNTAVRAADTELLGDLDQTAGGALTGLTLGLVDLGQHGVSGLGDDGGSETGDETGAEVVDGLHAVGGLALVDDGVDGLVDLLEDDELGAGDGTEARVESTNTLVLEDLAEAADQTVGELGVRDETNTGGLERAQGNVGDELSAGGGGEVDGGAVVGGSLVADGVDGLLLEELVSSELEGALKEVTSSGGAETSPDGASTLVGDDLAEATDEAGVGC
ncbi:hypothetical protein OPT61_g8892 [Boeremia exigua]|uniref:Uncharacterized protein n=1 Tax=Boeremia exigua TaxID=749465 RepID=A0ACC2HX11_9PLEO|nr:hypothetical protein OPT61_g8892 [Boeremia exigua]